MSTQKESIKNREKARRRPSSIYAEAELLRRIGWKVAFISGGYGAHSPGELRDMIKGVSEITGEPLWLNLGALSQEDLKLFGDSVKGVVGSVEALNPVVRSRVCPGKPLEPIIKMFKEADELGLEKAMTLILGLGEQVDDLSLLLDFIQRHGIHRITVYSLNPHEATPHADSPPPASLYQAGVISSLRLSFPEIKIVAGTWIDQLPNIGIMLLAGANGITKYPLFKMFGNRFGKKVEEEISFAKRRVVGTFTDTSRLNGRIDSKTRLDVETADALERYIQRIRVGL